MRLIVCAAALAVVPASAFADSFYAQTDRFGYTGSISVYDTLDDARAGTNARFSSIVVPQRDFALDIADGFGPGNDRALALTAWYYTTGGEPGTGNPSNNNVGFVQLYDEDASTVTSSSGRWLDSAFTSFELSLTGANADYENDYARLWNAGSSDTSGDATRGTFIEYAINLVATGLDGADYNGFGISTGHPTGVSGDFRGIFQNTSSAAVNNGFYVFDLDFNLGSWAYLNRERLATALFPSYFGAPAPIVPLPAAAWAGMILLGGLGAIRRFGRA